MTGIKRPGKAGKPHMTKEQREQINNRIKEISDRNGGTITPEEIVKDAKKSSSPLHVAFLWNDKEAAHHHRLDIARKLIRTYKVEVQTTRTVITAVGYVRDPRVDSDEQGYVSVAVLRNEKDMAREALRNELRRVISALERARSVAVGLDLEDEMEDLLSRTEALRARVLSQAA